MNKSITAAFLIVTSLCLNGQEASAKAYHPTMAENIQGAEYIAVVNLGAAQDKPTKGSHWTYAEESKAQLVQNIKGKLPKNFKVYGKENFVCAHCRFQAGQALVFLRKDGELLVGAGWDLAALAIKDGKVKWPSTQYSRIPDGQTELSAALQEIKQSLDKQP